MFKFIDDIDKKLHKKTDEIIEKTVERNMPKTEDEYVYEGDTRNDTVAEDVVFAESRKGGEPVEPWLRADGVVWNSDMARDNNGGGGRGPGWDAEEDDDRKEERQETPPPKSPPPPAIPDRNQRARVQGVESTSPRTKTPPQKLQPGQRVPLSSLAYLESPPTSPALSSRQDSNAASPQKQQQGPASPVPVVKKPGTVSVTATASRPLGSSMPAIQSVQARANTAKPAVSDAPSGSRTAPQSPAVQTRTNASKQPAPNPISPRSPCSPRTAGTSSGSKAAPDSPASLSRDAQMDVHVAKLQKLKTLYESDLITKEEYDQQRKMLLETFMAN